MEMSNCRGDLSGYDWGKLLFGLRRVFAAGPAGCVDWKMFMRGAAALAYLSLQDTNLGFDWTQGQITDTHPDDFPFDNNTKCLESAEDSLCF